MCLKLLCVIQRAKNTVQQKTLAGENFGEFSYLDCLGEKAWANTLFQINAEIKGSVKLREKTLAIGHQFAKFANVFSRQRFPLQCTVLIK